MKTRLISVNLVLFILSFLINCHVGNSDLVATNCINDGVYNVSTTNGRLYRNNLVSLFSVLASNASQPNGFYSYATGGGIDGPAAYGLFLCRGDVTPEACQACLARAFPEILRRCQNETRAVTWYDNCMLRYSDIPIFSKVETSGGWFSWERSFVTDGLLLSRVLGEVFDKITTRAAYGDLPGKKFAFGNANFTAFGKIYAMAQCTPDLSNLDCENCLRGAILDLPSCCNYRRGGRVLYQSCNIRYSTTPFYSTIIFPPPLLAVPPLPPPQSQIAPLLPPPPTSNQPAPPRSPVSGPVSNQGSGGISTTIATIVSSISVMLVFYLLNQT